MERFKLVSVKADHNKEVYRVKDQLWNSYLSRTFTDLDTCKNFVYEMNCMSSESWNKRGKSEYNAEV